MKVEHYPVHITGKSVHALGPSNCKSACNIFEGEDFVPPNPITALDVNRLLCLWGELAETIDPENPWEHPKASEWDSMTVLEWLRVNTWADDALKLGELAIQSVLCKQPSEVSLFYWLWYI